MSTQKPRPARTGALKRRVVCSSHGVVLEPVPCRVVYDRPVSVVLRCPACVAEGKARVARLRQGKAGKAALFNGVS